LKIYVLHGSVATQLERGGIYNNPIIANCLQSATVKEFRKLVSYWRRYWQKQSATFLWPTVYIRISRHKYSFKTMHKACKNLSKIKPSSQRARVCALTDLS